MRVRDAAIALAATALLATPALAQGNWSGSHAYRPELSRQTVKTIQERLQHDGLYRGHIDGLWGPETRSAVLDYQRQHGMQPNGRLNTQTLADLGLRAPKTQQVGSNQSAMPSPISSTGTPNAGMTSASPGKNSMPATTGSHAASGNTGNNSIGTYKTGMSNPGNNRTTPEAQQ